MTTAAPRDVELEVALERIISAAPAIVRSFRPQDAPATSYALLPDVARFRLTYLTRDNAWIDRWPVAGDADLPRAVRVQLTLSSGETIERWLALR